MTNDVNGFDVIVVGCEVAGPSVAVSAREQGTSVALSERATHEERGGGMRYAEGCPRMKGTSAILPS